MDSSKYWNVFHLADEPLYYAAPHRAEDVVVEDSDADDTPTTKYYRRARRQEIGYKYLAGERPFIQSASLRGPFAEGWTNPWRCKSTRTSRQREQARRTNAVSNQPNRLNNELATPEKERAITGTKSTLSARVRAEDHAEQHQLATFGLPVEIEESGDEEELMGVSLPAQQVDADATPQPTQENFERFLQREHPRESVSGSARKKRKMVMEWLKGDADTKRTKWDLSQRSSPTPCLEKQTSKSAQTPATSTGKVPSATARARRNTDSSADEMIELSPVKKKNTPKNKTKVSLCSSTRRSSRSQKLVQQQASEDILQPSRQAVPGPDDVAPTNSATLDSQTNALDDTKASAPTPAPANKRTRETSKRESCGSFKFQSKTTEKNPQVELDRKSDATPNSKTKQPSTGTIEKEQTPINGDPDERSSIPTPKDNIHLPSKKVDTPKSTAGKAARKARRKSKRRASVAAARAVSQSTATMDDGDEPQDSGVDVTTVETLRAPQGQTRKRDKVQSENSTKASETAVESTNASSTLETNDTNQSSSESYQGNDSSEYQVKRGSQPLQELSRQAIPIEDSIINVRTSVAEASDSFSKCSTKPMTPTTENTESQQAAVTSAAQGMESSQNITRGSIQNALQPQSSPQILSTTNQSPWQVSQPYDALCGRPQETQETQENPLVSDPPKLAQDQTDVSENCARDAHNMKDMSPTDEPIVRCTTPEVTLNSPSEQNSPAHPMFSDLIQSPPKSARSRLSLPGGLPSTQMLMEAAVSNPWSSALKKSSRKTRKRVSFSPSLAQVEPHSLQARRQLGSPPAAVTRRLFDADSSFTAHFKVTKNLSFSDDSCPPSSPCVDAMAEAFRSADRHLEGSNAGAERTNTGATSWVSINAVQKADMVVEPEPWKAPSPDPSKRIDDALAVWEDEENLNAVMDEVSDFFEHWDVDAELKKAAVTRPQDRGSGVEPARRVLVPGILNR